MKLLKCLHGGKLTFVACSRKGGEEGGSARLIKRNNTTYKFFWCEDQSGFRGVME